jgi:hypothetical protein
MEMLGAYKAARGPSSSECKAKLELVRDAETREVKAVAQQLTQRSDAPQLGSAPLQDLPVAADSSFIELVGLGKTQLVTPPKDDEEKKDHMRRLDVASEGDASSFCELVAPPAKKQRKVLVSPLSSHVGRTMRRTFMTTATSFSAS